MTAALTWRDEPINRHDTVTIRIIWVAFVLSLLVHIAALWTAPPLMRPLAFEPSDKPENSPALIAQLAPRASPPDKAPPSATAHFTAVARRAAARAHRAATDSGAGASDAAAHRADRDGSRPGPRAPATADASCGGAAASGRPRRWICPPTLPHGAMRVANRPRHRTRSAPNAPPAETEKERLNRIVAANLGLNKTPTFGDDPKRGGGMFQIRRIGYDDAEFIFNGWNQDIGRVARQVIEVRKGSNPDIRIAVVRKIIEIIRAHEPGDFIWVSRRMNRQVPLSARPADNAALEDYMMREFFGGDQRQP